MLKYIALFAALGAVVLAQDSLMDDLLLEQDLQLPCTPKPCVPICKPVTKYVSYGAFKLPYTENVCVDDKACLTANAKCIATLQAAMKAAEAAEKDMIAKSKAANSAKATKAQKDAAAASKKAEEAAAKKSLDGAKAAFEVAEKETATAKAASVAAAAAFAAKSKVMNTRLGEYEKAKAGHLNAQKAYANAKGEAAEAADAYAAAVKAHCDAEAVHAKAVENIGHGHLKQDKCAKPVPEVTALKGKTSQSSEGWSGGPSRAVDGNAAQSYGSGTCTHTTNSGKPWWKLDFGSSKTVVKVQVWNRSDCCASRLNGVQVKVGSSVCGTLTSSTSTQTVTCNKKGSSLVMQMPRSDYLTLCEVKVTGH
jgi:hypothetical protein